MAQPSTRAFTARLLAWCGVTALAFLSWFPGDDMIRTGINGRIEHVLAYAGVTCLVTLAYASRIGFKAIAILMALYAGLLEIGQTVAIGRHAAIWDFLASCVGILIGSSLHTLVRTGARRRRTLHHFLSSLTD